MNPRRRFLVVETDTNEQDSKQRVRIAESFHEASNAYEYVREHDDRELRATGHKDRERCIWDNRLGRVVYEDDLPAYATQGV